jgi:putative DNA primase/helicase
MTTPTDTLMVKNGQSIPGDVARLMGARFVSASESGDGRRLDEELIKRISGGDRMSARFLHHDWFEFYPVLKLWLAANHKPTIRGTDHGIWRRIHLIPFTVTFPPSKQDRKLMSKLHAEASGILAWAVRGCLEWQRSGLQPPQVVQDATEEYRTEMDTFGTFLAECCVLQRGAQMTNKALRQAYHEWCDENAEREQPQTRLSQTLQDRGIEKGRDHKGATIWYGVGLLTEPTQESFS